MEKVESESGCCVRVYLHVQLCAQLACLSLCIIVNLCVLSAQGDLLVLALSSRPT